MIWRKGSSKMKCYISSSCSTKILFPEVMKELVDVGFRSINIVQHAIDLSNKLGNNMYSLHPGYKHELLPKMIDGFFIKEVQTENCNARDVFYQTVRDVAAANRGTSFKIAIENLSPKNSAEIYSFLCGPDDIMDFLGHFQDVPAVGILLDLGHLNIAAQILGFDKYEVLDKLFSSYGDRIFEIHVSDNDGTKDFYRISALDSWQIEYLTTKSAGLKEVPVVMEWQACASRDSFDRYERIRERLENA